MIISSQQISVLKRLFGTEDIQYSETALTVAGKIYPIHDGVIHLDVAPASAVPFAEDIQFTFGSEWERYPAILPEDHAKLFADYFDLVDLPSLHNKTVCDLGCGMGRFAWFMKDRCAQIVLVDFSDAIYVARKNLVSATNALFFKCDIQQLPFADDAFDLGYSLGVLHHLPVPCLDALRALERFSPQWLVYLYYSLDNRPIYFRWILGAVTGVRLVVTRIRNKTFRKLFSVFGAAFLYVPLIALGRCFALFGKGSSIPLYDAYKDHSFGQIEQDVYDRFFTRIEQRVFRKEIETLKDTYSDVRISDRLPYHHFLCIR